MRNVITKMLLVGGILLIKSNVACAQPLIAQTSSLENMVANADLVFVAKLIKIHDNIQRDGRTVHNTSIAIEETLKQDLTTTEPYHQRIQMYMYQSKSTLLDWKERSARLLVAYDEYAPYLTTVLELAPGKMEVFKTDFTLLREPDAVIRAARETVRQLPKGVKRYHTFRLMVPQTLVAKTSWGKYHGLYLNVPVNEALEKRALKYIRSKHYREREEGIRALRYFQSDENTSKAKTLLNDPGWAFLHHAQENNGIEVRYYGVRQEAYRTLTKWEVDVEQPVVREEVRKPFESSG